MIMTIFMNMNMHDPRHLSLGGLVGSCPLAAAGSRSRHDDGNAHQEPEARFEHLMLKVEMVESEA